MNITAARDTAIPRRRHRLRPINSPSFGQTSKTPERARCWFPCGRIVADLAPTETTPSRLAHLNISFGLLKRDSAPWAARFWEQDAPAGIQPVEWLLDSRSCLSSLEDALQLLHDTPGLVETYAVI